MESLFGVSIDYLLPVSLTCLVTLLVLIGFFLLKNRFILNLTLRDLPRRPAQTTLIIAGLTFGTIIITTSFITGDTLIFSIRNQSLTSLGDIDIIVEKPTNSTTQLATISQLQYEQFKTQTQEIDEIDAFVVSIIHNVSLTNEAEGQSVSNAKLFAPDLTYDTQLTNIKSLKGSQIKIASLESNQIYINQKGADLLLAQAGDTIDVFINGQRASLQIKEIIQNQALLSSPQTVVIVSSLNQARSLLDIDQQITSILISSNTSNINDTDSNSDLVTQLRIQSIDKEIAEQIANHLRHNDILAFLDAEANAIPEQETRLRSLALALIVELQRTDISSELISLLGDSQVENWLMSRDINQSTQDELTSLFTQLSEFNVKNVKDQAIAESEQAGGFYSQLFLVFGSFSIFAGMLLIFQIFIMLAAERKSEFGMARAIGLQRYHIIQFFTSTGIIYDIFAATLGVFVGLAVTYLMVTISGDVLTDISDQTDALQFVATPRSLLLAFCLGILTTFVVVFVSSWRISKLNIVAAIRNLPDVGNPEKRTRLQKLWSLLQDPLLILLGIILINSAYASSQLAPAMIGIALVIIGNGRLLKIILKQTTLRITLQERIVYTAIGLGLLVFFAAPFGTWDTLLGFDQLESSVEVFVIAGIMVVAGAIWLFIYNGDLSLHLLNRILGRIGSLTPILKTATAYPLSARFRTGLTLAMFSIIIFTVIVMTIITQADEQVLSKSGIEIITGGYDIQGVVLGTTPTENLKASLRDSSEGDSISLIGSASVVPINIRQAGVDNKTWVDYTINGYDNDYIQQVRQYYAFKLRAPGYEDDEAIWQALQERDDVIVIGRSNVPSSQSIRVDQSSFMLESFYWEDETLPPDIYVEVRVPQSDEIHKLQVIGVLNSSWIGNFMGGIHTKDTIATHIARLNMPPSIYFVQAKPQVDVSTLAQTIEKEFLSIGLETTSMQQLILDSLSSSKALNQLLRGYIALGLLIGITSLGAISSRSVIERRQQIGMLRAIGYHRSMVLLSFLIEAGFVAFIGILIGTLLGLNVGWNIINELAKDQPGLFFDPPILKIMAINLAAFLLSLLMTSIPALQATKIAPAEALRYE